MQSLSSPQLWSSDADRLPSLTAAPTTTTNGTLDSLCADVRQHIISFLGFNLKAHLANCEYACPGAAKRGPKAAASRSLLLAHVRGSVAGGGLALFLASESQTRFPWLSSTERRYSESHLDLVTVQLISRSWYDDFHATVLDCDEIMVHRALQLRKKVKPFQVVLDLYLGQVSQYLGGQQMVHCLGSRSPPRMPDAILSASKLLDDVAPVSAALHGIFGKSAPSFSYTGDQLSVHAFCLTLIEDFPRHARKLLTTIDIRDLTPLRIMPAPPAQCIIDALEPIALILQQRKKDGTDVRVCSPASPLSRIKLLQSKNKPIPEELEFAEQDDEEMWRMEWEDIRSSLLATPHYLLLDLELRPKLDLLTTRWCRDRIEAVANHHRRNHSLTVAQVSNVCPAVGVLYAWFWDLVAVNKKLLKAAGDLFEMDNAAAALAVCERDRLLQNAATVVYRGEIRNIIESEQAPIDALHLANTIQTTYRLTVEAEEAHTRQLLVSSIPEPPKHTMRLTGKFKTIHILKKSQGNSIKFGATAAAAREFRVPPPRTDSQRSTVTLRSRPTMRMH